MFQRACVQQVLHVTVDRTEEFIDPLVHVCAALNGADLRRVRGAVSVPVWGTFTQDLIPGRVTVTFTVRPHVTVRYVTVWYVAVRHFTIRVPGVELGVSEVRGDGLLRVDVSSVELTVRGDGKVVLQEGRHRAAVLHNSRLVTRKGRYRPL